MGRWLLLVGALACASPARAFTHDAQLWVLASVEGRVRGPALYFFEAQPRLSLEAGGPYQALLRPALGFEVAPFMSIWAGVAWVPAFDVAGAGQLLSVGEGRFFQQLVLKTDLAGASVLSRTRFEQRALQTDPRLGLRARTMLRGTLPVALDDALYAVAWDEVFANAAPSLAFDQNRAFVGAGYKVDAFSVEAGYLNRATVARMDHALFTWLSFKLY